jgi:hypothetical protein
VNGAHRAAALSGVVILILMVGWFTMSYLLMHNTVADALGEALGVGLGLLVVASVVGAVRSSRNAQGG